MCLLTNCVSLRREHKHKLYRLYALSSNGFLVAPLIPIILSVRISYMYLSFVTFFMTTCTRTHIPSWIWASMTLCYAQKKYKGRPWRSLYSSILIASILLAKRKKMKIIEKYLAFPHCFFLYYYKIGISHSRIGHYFFSYSLTCTNPLLQNRTVRVR